MDGFPTKHDHFCGSFGTLILSHSQIKHILLQAPGVMEYQPLHMDLNFPGCRGHPENQAPVVTLNVALEPLTWRNGPTWPGLGAGGAGENFIFSWENC